MITNKQICERMAKRLVDYLTSKGIEAKSDFAFKPIRKVLSWCYYVQKVKECGHTDCIHVDLPYAGSFIAVLEDGRLMSGFHLMIQDAIYSIGRDYLEDLADAMEYPTFDKFICDDTGDFGMSILDFNKFKEWLDSQMPLSVGKKVI